MQKYEVTYLKGQGENFTELAKEYARENIGAASDNFVKTEIDKKQDQLTKGPNIDIYTKDKKTYISATIPSKYVTKEWVESQGYAKDTKTWEELEKKLDLSAFSEVSGDFLTEKDLNPYYKKTETLNTEEIKDELDKKLDAGDYLSANALDSISGKWERVSEKLDITASDIFVQRPELEPYALSADITDNYYTNKEVDEKFTEYTKTEDLPTKLSEFDNDCNFISGVYTDDIMTGNGTQESPISVSIMEGATETDNGKKGLVPEPTVDDIDKFLKGDGTWADPEIDLSDYVKYEDLVGITTIKAGSGIIIKTDNALKQSTISVDDNYITSATMDALENIEAEILDIVDDTSAYLQEQIDDINSDIDSMVDVASDLSAAIERNKFNIDDLSAKLNNTEFDIYSAFNAINNLEEKHDADVSALNDKINTLEIKHDYDVSALNDKIDTLEIKHDYDILVVNTRIDNLEEKHDVDVSVLNDKIDETNEFIENSISAVYDVFDNRTNILNSAVNNAYDMLKYKLDTSALQPALEDYTFNKDEIINISGLTNYYDIITIDEKLKDIRQFGGYKVVTADEEGKPDVKDPETNVIYLIKIDNLDPDLKDIYQEWIYSDNEWLMIGDTSIDLKPYVKTETLSAVSSLLVPWTDYRRLSKSFVMSSVKTIQPNTQYGLTDKGWTTISAYSGVGSIGVNDFEISLKPAANCVYDNNYTDSLILGSSTGTGQYNYIAGNGLLSETDNNTVFGYYNKPYEDQIFAVGNGTEDERSNAMWLDKYGNMIIKGDLTINGDTSLNTLLVNPKFALIPYSYEIRDIFTAPYTHTMSLTPEKRIKAFDNLDIFVMPSGTYKYDFDCDIHVTAGRYIGMEDWELRLAKNILEVSGTVELSEVPVQITRGAKTDTSTEIKFADRYGKTIGAIDVPCPNVSVNNYNIGEFVVNDLDHDLKYEIKFNDDAVGTVYINNYEMYDNIIDSIEMIDDGYKIFRLKLEGFTVSDKHFELVPEIYRKYSSTYNKTDINQITVNVHNYYIEKLK